MSRVSLVTKNGRWSVSLAPSSPPNLVALDFDPEFREAALEHGTWLVAAVPVWSSPDREALEVAVELASVHPDLKVAIRPFDDEDELKRWCSLTERGVTPFWFVFEEGRQMGMLVDGRGRFQVERFVAGILGDERDTC
jgi:hypothetical protein